MADNAAIAKQLAKDGADPLIVGVLESPDLTASQREAVLHLMKPKRRTRQA